MPIFRCIAPAWLLQDQPSLPAVREGELSEEERKELNSKGYNIYFLPNYPSQPEHGVPVSGYHIDIFNYVFLDLDLKDGVYKSKQEFLTLLNEFPLKPSFVTDSGNGIHAYWRVTDLAALPFLQIQRRLIRKFNTDEAVAKIYQLMRVPGSFNTKDKENFKLCDILQDSPEVYTCEQFDNALPPLTKEDAYYCQQHYEKTYRLNSSTVKIDDNIPLKFAHLIRSSAEAKSIWAGESDDRSKGDYRLGHLMFANGFTKAEATSVLVNSAKALGRSDIHRQSYALNIIDKIWTYELEGEKALTLSSSVRDILSKGERQVKGARFPCYRHLDATSHGFRLGQVIGLVAGSGVGKTAYALNMFMGFVENNPDYEHFFIPLEQTPGEIATRWKNMCQERTNLYDKVHVMANYNDDGSFRHLSLAEIKDYLLKFQETTGKKIGCVVIDHIGALKKKTKDGENQGLMEICHEMKAFAIQTNTLVVMQSQTNRDKAGIGDLELNKDAAFGTMYFEAYCDYLVCLWQPLKRTYGEKSCPLITAFKFAKIRHKKQGFDDIQEDTCYSLVFDAQTERFRELTQVEEKQFEFFNAKCTKLRGQDRKTGLVEYKSIEWTKEATNERTAEAHTDEPGTRSA